MNRRQKIIVSVVGIFIVLLALVGITYGYFLTRIQGNTNTTSITVTTADLKLVYGDGNEDIESASVLMPGEDFKFIGRDAQGNILTDTNGDIIEYDSKTFSVTNNGNTTVEDYAVVIEDISVTYASNATLEDGTTVTEGQSTTFDRPQDFVYILTCESTDSNDCNGQTEKVLPMQDSILVTNTIAKDVTHNYTLKIKYLAPDVNQSKDMNKTFKMKVNIYDVRTFNPYENNTDSLAYNIINNSMSKANGTELLAKPLTTPAAAISSVTSYKTTGEEATYTNSKNAANVGKTWYYYDTYVIDKTTGKFTLSGKHSCIYNSTTTNTDGETVNCYDDMKEKYLAYAAVSPNTNASKHTAETLSDLPYVTKVTSATLSTYNYVYVYNSPTAAERVLATTTDDFGTSYYYRGDIEDNYVNFAGMCWRIVRIAGDGSIKLILEDRYTTCNDTEDTDGTGTTDYAYTGNWSDDNYYVFGYDVNKKADFLNYTATDGLQYSFKTFQTTLAKKINTSLTNTSTQEEINTVLASKLKIDEWCYDDKVTATDGTIEYYGAYTRIKINETPSLNCTGTKLTKYNDNNDMYIGTITADEIALAGADANNTENSNFYLMNNYAKQGSKGLSFWSFSLYNYNGSQDMAFRLEEEGVLFYDILDNNDSEYSRPAVSLKTGSVITDGVGTIDDPYEIG